jgi:xanthine dehydrogenase iron-sulfur cluster and FAD-binding subunit A
MTGGYMPNIGQIQRGFVAFLDNEIAPKLSGLTRVMVTAGGGVIASKLPVLLANPSVAGLAGVLSLMDDNGEVDIETLYTEFKRAVQQTGNITVDIPIPFQGPLSMTFRDADLDRLYQYIKQQNP